MATARELKSTACLMKYKVLASLFSRLRAVHPGASVAAPAMWRTAESPAWYAQRGNKGI
jgi:hypothetical protein